MSEGKTYNRPRFDGVNFYASPEGEKDLFSMAGGTDENGISSEHRRYRDEFKKLLGPMVAALLRDAGGSLDVSKIRVKDFAEFKQLLQRQAELNDGKSFHDPYQSLLEDENFEPLLKLLYQEIDSDFYVVLSVPETEALFKEFQAKLIEIDSDVFVRNQYNSKEGRENIRHVLGDVKAFTQDQRSEVLKSVARAAEEEETLWFGGSHGLKLSDHVSLFNYFNWGLSEGDVANATDIAQDYLKDADEREQARAIQEEQYSKNPGEVRVGLLCAVLGRKISKLEIQEMAHLAKAGVKDPDPRKQVQGHLAELWLLAVDTRRFGQNTEEAYGINAYLVEQTEKLIEASKKIESDKDLEEFNEKLQEFLNGPIPDLEKGKFTRWLKHQTVGLGLKEQFESYPLESRLPYEKLVQFSDKWKYALECGEKILLDHSRKEAVDPTVEEAKSQLIVGLQKTQQELWYNYKQHKALSRGMSQGAHLLNPQYAVAKWLAPDQAHHLAIGDYAEIDAANIELAKLIESLQGAETKEEVEAQLQRLNELIKPDGILYQAFQAAEMDGTEQVIGLVQTVAIILGTTQATRGVSLIGNGAEAVFLADKMLRGFFWGAYVATAENAVAVSTGEVRAERDTIGNWTKDAVSTGASMALVMPAAGSVGQALEGNTLKNLAARYLNPGGLTRLAGDTALETLEEAVDQQLRKTLDGKANALSPGEIKELFKLCLAGGGLQIGAIAKNFQSQVETKSLENVAEEKEPTSRRNPLLNPLLAPMWMMLGANGIGGGGNFYRQPAYSSQGPFHDLIAEHKITAYKVLNRYPNGGIDEIELTEDQIIWERKFPKGTRLTRRYTWELVLPEDGRLTLGKDEIIGPNRFEIREDGKLDAIKLANGQNIQGISFSREDDIYFNETEKVQRAKISTDMRFNGLLYLKGDTVFFGVDKAKLKARLKDWGSVYRVEPAEILARSGEAEGYIFLREQIQEPGISRILTTILTEISDVIVTKRAPDPSHRLFWERKVAANALGRLGAKEDIDLFQAWLKDSDPDRQALAESALAEHEKTSQASQAHYEGEAEVSTEAELGSRNTRKGGIDGPLGFFLSAGAGLATLLGSTEAQAAVDGAATAMNRGGLSALGVVSLFAISPAVLGVFSWIRKSIFGNWSQEVREFRAEASRLSKGDPQVYELAKKLRSFGENKEINYEYRKEAEELYKEVVATQFRAGDPQVEEEAESLRKQFIKRIKTEAFDDDALGHSSFPSWRTDYEVSWKAIELYAYLHDQVGFSDDEAKKGMQELRGAIAGAIFSSSLSDRRFIQLVQVYYQFASKYDDLAGYCGDLVIPHSRVVDDLKEILAKPHQYKWVGEESRRELSPLVNVLEASGRYRNSQEDLSAAKRVAKKKLGDGNIGGSGLALALISTGAGLVTLLGASEAQAAVAAVSPQAGTGSLAALAGGIGTIALGGIFHWLSKSFKGNVAEVIDDNTGLPESQSNPSAQSVYRQQAEVSNLDGSRKEAWLRDEDVTSILDFFDFFHQCNRILPKQEVLDVEAALEARIRNQLGWRGEEGEEYWLHKKRVEAALADAERSQNVRRILELTELPVRDRLQFQNIWKQWLEQRDIGGIIEQLRKQRNVEDPLVSGEIAKIRAFALLVEYLKYGSVPEPSPPQTAPLPEALPPGLVDRVKAWLHRRLKASKP